MHLKIFHRRSKESSVEGEKDESLTPLTRRQLFQYREQVGVNLGGLYVMEKWIDSSLFAADSKGDSELNALESQMAAGKTLDEIRHMWEARWSSFLEESDYELLSHNVNCIRLPIGFWAVNNGAYTRHTPFEKFKPVYYNAWASIRQLIARLDNMDIGVIIDVHALPGGANGESHSGTSSGVASFWDKSSLQQQALELYGFIVEDLAGFDNVVGLEIMNESPYDQKGYEAFALRACKKIRKIDPNIAIILPDGWDLLKALKMVSSLEALLARKELIDHNDSNILIDTHVYRTFSEADHQKSAIKHVQEAKTCVPVTTLEEKIMVGEFSACLDEESWRLAGDCDRSALEERFCREQTRCFEKNSTAGHFFWTFKFAGGAAGTWDFREMVKRQAWRFNTKVSATEGKAIKSENEFYQAWLKHRDDASKLVESKEGAIYADGYSRGVGDRLSFAQLKSSKPSRVTSLCNLRFYQAYSANKGLDADRFCAGYKDGLKTGQKV